MVCAACPEFGMHLRDRTKKDIVWDVALVPCDINKSNEGQIDLPCVQYLIMALLLNLRNLITLPVA